MTEWKKPNVGDGATKIGFTDLDPYTVSRVSESGKACWVKADNYRRTDNNGISDVGQQYKFTPNPDAEEVEVRWTGKRWKSATNTFLMGQRKKFHDYCF